MRYEQRATAEIMRLVLVTGFCLGTIFGVFLTGFLVVIRR